MMNEYKKLSLALLLGSAIVAHAQIGRTRISSGNIGTTKIEASKLFDAGKTVRHLLANTTTSIVKRNDRNASNGQPERSPINARQGSTTVDKNDNNRVCRTEYRSYTVESLNQDIVDPNAIARLRLGGVYSLEDLSKGDYNTLPNAKHPEIPARAPINISLSDRANAVKVESPTDEALRNALESIRSVPYPVRPASKSQYLESSLVNTETDFNLALGVSYTGAGVKASNYFNYSANNKTTKYLINYVNAVYTADASPVSSGAFFLNNKNLINDPSLVYIDKITYGVRFMVCFEAEAEEKEITDKFKGSGWNVTATMDLAYKSKFAKTQFKAYMYGSNEPLFTATGVDELRANVDRTLANIMSKSLKNPIELGSPVSYSLRFLDGSIAATNCKVENMPSQYCFANPDRPMDLAIGIDNIVNTNRDIWGWIDVELLDKNGVTVGTPQTIFNAPGKNTAVPSLSKDKCSNYNIVLHNISKEDRDAGIVRLWFWINTTQDNYCPVIGDNAKQVSYTTKPGHSGNHYYVDVPISQIMQNQSIEKPYTRPFTAQENKGDRSKFTPTFSFVFK